MISYAQITNTDILTPLWQHSFGDELSVIQAFWERTAGIVTAYAALDGCNPVSMLCALPVTLYDDCGASYRCAYLYAVCTEPEYRRQGLCTALFTFAEQGMRVSGFDACVLVPSSEKMFDFYRNLGYETAFYHKAYEAAAHTGNVKIAKLTADGYRNLRELQLYGSFLSYDTSLLTLQQEYGEASGAGLYRLETEDTVCCAAAEKQDSCLLVKELLPDCPDAAAALAEKLGCTHFIVSTEGVALPFGMIKALRKIDLPGNSYLGLAFD